MEQDRSDRLEIRDRPWISWLFIAGMIIISIYLTLSGVGVPWQASVTVLIIGLVMLLIVGLGSACILDRQNNSAVVEIYTIFGKKRREFLLSDIQGARLQHSRSSSTRSSSRTYRVALVTIAGEEVPLTSYLSSGYLSKQRTADKIQAFLGQPSIMEQARQLVSRPTSVESQEDVTAGVPWRMEWSTSGAGGKTTRWLSEAVQLPGQFVMMMQSPGGKPMPALGGLMNSVMQLTTQQYCRMYQVDPSDLPGLASAESVQGVDSLLEQNFITLTNDAYGMHQLLTPWVVNPLVAWAERYPARGLQVMKPGEYGPLFVLAYPGGLLLGFANDLRLPAQVQEITNLGVDLARALGAPAS
ncbi:MAG: hypothetical protein AB1894_09490 [Chloroflexota bacterium]